MNADQALKIYKGALQYHLKHPERFIDTKPLDLNEGFYIFQELHPTKRRESLEITAKLVTFLIRSEVTTMEDVQRELGVSHPAILKRLKVLRRQGMVKRESKKFYIATPRLIEFQAKFLKRLLKGAV